MNIPANQEGNLPLHVMINITRAATDMEHLLLLNGALTNARASGQEMGSRDREALLALGSNFQDQLAIVERHAYSLNQYFGPYGAWIDERLQNEFAGELDSEKENIKRILAVENDKYSERGVALTEMLMQQLPLEREKIRKNVFTVQADQVFLGPDGVGTDVGAGTGASTELASSTACTVGALATMICLIGCPASGVACVCAVVAGALVIIYCP